MMSKDFEKQINVLFVLWVFIALWVYDAQLCGLVMIALIGSEIGIMIGQEAFKQLKQYAKMYVDLARYEKEKKLENESNSPSNEVANDS